MNRDRQSSGSAGSPIKYPRASRQTTEAQPPRTRPHTTRKPTLGDDENENAWTVDKPHSSAVRYDYPYLSPRHRTQDVSNPKRTQLVRQRRVDKWTFITWLSIAIMVMAGGWFVYSKISDWWAGVHDNMVYGTPFRTSQADQYVNLGDTPTQPDHFIALNLHGVIVVMQLNPRDSKQDVIYPIASVGNDSIPASLSFRDTTGSGRTDVVVTIGDTTPYTVILVNNGKTFTPTQPAH